MVARKIFNHQLRSLFTISIIWMIYTFGMVYNVREMQVKVILTASALYLSLIAGLVGFIISASLIFYLKDAFKKYPLWISLLLKMFFTFLLFVLIGFILLAIYAVFLYQGNFNAFTQKFFAVIIISEPFVIFMANMAMMTFITIIIIEITDKYGPGMFWSILIGEYHIPKIENRIFLFLDINASTSIAEHLGHTRYFLLLKEFFSDVTIPVLANGGQIYQYVGDEIVLSWRNTEENKHKCLKFIRNTFYLIKRREKKYIKRYGVLPEFKVGVHAGEVTAGFIGIVKKDLIYSGDTLNTTARIRSMCHELNHSFILSEDFLQHFTHAAPYEIAAIGELEIKGRSEPVKLFSLSFD